MYDMCTILLSTKYLTRCQQSNVFPASCLLTYCMRRRTRSTCYSAGRLLRVSFDVSRGGSWLARNKECCQAQDMFTPARSSSAHAVNTVLALSGIERFFISFSTCASSTFSGEATNEMTVVGRKADKSVRVEVPHLKLSV